MKKLKIVFQKDMWCKDMRYETRKYLDMPKVLVDGRLFVDKEYFVNKVILDIRDRQKDCDSQDESDGMDEAMKILLNT